jgi:hypothetical protein
LTVVDADVVEMTSDYPYNPNDADDDSRRSLGLGGFTRKD